MSKSPLSTGALEIESGEMDLVTLALAFAFAFGMRDRCRSNKAFETLIYSTDVSSVDWLRLICTV